MKTLKKLLFIVLFLGAAITLSAQTPPHPNGGNSPSGSNTPVGGGAPLAGGLLILLSLGFGYGARNIFDARKKVLE